jgi:hypothetical protein
MTASTGCFELARRLEEIGEALGRDDISIETASVAEKRIRADLELARSKVTPARKPFTVFETHDLVARWPAMTVAEQERIVRTYIGRLELLPVTKRQNTVSLERVVVYPVEGVMLGPQYHAHVVSIDHERVAPERP